MTVSGTEAQEIAMHVIARIHTPLGSKFGVPRQSGLVDALKGRIVFEPEYRISDAVRGLDAWSHIWLIWQFSEAVRSTWSPTVRPPRLGGNTRIGVFATRSPFRPNNIGLSCVRLERVESTPDLGPVLHVSGADLMDGTPILDIKPYLPYADLRPDATGGFTDSVARRTLRVELPDVLTAALTQEEREALCGVLAQDPRPAYQDDPSRIYGFAFGRYNVRFRVEDGTAYLIAVE